MAMNLRARLARIREAAKEAPPANALPREPEQIPPVEHPAVDMAASLFFPGTVWTCRGQDVLGRVVRTALPEPLRADKGPVSKAFCFPETLPVIIRDCYRYGSVPRPESLVFFDLETTGLSGGAGTLAFLASFGRITPNEHIALAAPELSTTQYLLLDYPGEAVFLELLKAEFSRASRFPPLVVTYNGKTFDSQIFRNRCLMNAIIPPEYFHADLLHPSRRLWKRVLPNCSQGTIETEILGLDRSGDTPGALAPDIWFSFLKTGQTGELAGICDHNVRDIRGLAAIWFLVAEIAAAPLAALESRCYDFESLALLWHESECRANNTRGPAYAESRGAVALLEAAAEKRMPRALYIYGTELLRTDPRKGRGLLLELARDANAGVDSRAAAFRALAIDSEWRERDAETALCLAESALALPELRKGTEAEFERRRDRLLRKQHGGLCDNTDNDNRGL